MFHFKVWEFYSSPKQNLGCELANLFHFKAWEFYSSPKQNLGCQLANKFCMVLFMISNFIVSCPQNFENILRILRTLYQTLLHRDISLIWNGKLSYSIFALRRCVYYKSKGFLSSINTRACKEKIHWVIEHKLPHLILNTSRTLQGLFHRVHYIKYPATTLLFEFFTKAKNKSKQ